MISGLRYRIWAEFMQVYLRGVDKALKRVSYNMRKFDDNPHLLIPTHPSGITS